MTSMNSHNISKLNQLLHRWPRGTVAVQSWLEKQGVYRQLAETYRKGGWVERIGEGAYIQRGDHVDWTGGLYALQMELGMQIHIAAISALEMQGYAHFLPMGKGHAVWLFKDTQEKRNLPVWVKKRFAQDNQLKVLSRKLFQVEWKLGLMEKKLGEYSVFVSSPERAMMEYLDLVPQRQSLEQALLLMEGLQTLRPQLVQELLEKCTSVKVKRLFIWAAEQEGHPWVKKLDLSHVDFGRGKRMIVKGGKFNNKYNLSLPLQADEEDDDAR